MLGFLCGTIIYPMSPYLRELLYRIITKLTKSNQYYYKIKPISIGSHAFSHARRQARVLA